MKYLSAGILRDYAFRKWPANWKNSECGLFERQIQGKNRGKSRRHLGDINLVSYHLSRFLYLLWKFTIAFYFLRFWSATTKMEIFQTRFYETFAGSLLCSYTQFSKYPPKNYDFFFIFLPFVDGFNCFCLVQILLCNYSKFNKKTLIKLEIKIGVCVQGVLL